MTIRQLFYRLVNAGLIRNSKSDYKKLSQVIGKDGLVISWAEAKPEKHAN